MRKTPAIAAVVLGLSLTLSACGSEDPNGSDHTGTSSEAASTEHNATDVAFATDMIEHHAQALSMADLTVGRELDPDVQALADAIRAAQAPEIELMTDWLQEWGEEVPETADGDHAAAGHGDGHMEGGDIEGLGPETPGMMSADDMRALEETSEADFQGMWLQMMIDHHEGAVDMARTEISDGQYRPAVDLARNIVQSQTAEIRRMQELLSRPSLR